MFKFSKTITLSVLCSVGLLFGSSAYALDDFSGVGRAATPAEIKAWNIDVRPDFQGLPPGSGSVDQGQTIWEGKCAVCHGTFGESNKVFTPLIGGVEKGDLETGHVASLMRKDFPARTTFMKVPTVSTLWDYIHRAMPWNAPKSLSNNDVYAVLAYLLNLSDIVPDDFVLNEKTIRDVQKIMPNRNGITYDHAFWPGNEFGSGSVKPDTHNVICMQNCKPQVELGSHLPDYAEASHGNLAEQNRLIGPVRGRPSGTEVAAVDSKPTPQGLLEASGCLACHGLTNKIVGPAYSDVAQKYKGQDMSAKLIAKIRAGGSGVWGDTAMPPQTEIKDEDLKTVVAWILKGAAP